MHAVQVQGIGRAHGAPLFEAARDAQEGLMVAHPVCQEAVGPEPLAGARLPHVLVAEHRVEVDEGQARMLRNVPTHVQVLIVAALPRVSLDPRSEEALPRTGNSRGFRQPMREEINGNQWQSVAIISNQCHSEAHRGTQRQSGAITHLHVTREDLNQWQTWHSLALRSH